MYPLLIVFHVLLFRSSEPSTAPKSLDSLDPAEQQSTSEKPPVLLGGGMPAKTLNRTRTKEDYTLQCAGGGF